MLFKLGDEIVNIARVKVEIPTISKHTGKELEKLTFDLDVRGTYFEKLKYVLEESNNGGIFSVNEEGNIIKEYKLVNYFYSFPGNYTDDNTVYSYTLTIEEVERLNIKSLFIAGIEIVPYEYSEEYDDGIIINAKIKILKEDMEKIYDVTRNNRYFEVIRNGISDDVKFMRFGKVIWSEDGKYTKQNITLVEKCYDEKDSRLKQGLFEPELSNIIRMLSYVTNLNNELISILNSNKVISNEDLEKIKSKATQDIYKTYQEFYKVKDIDEF